MKINKKYIILIIFLNLFIYLPVILLLPHFQADDYYIFAVVKDNPGSFFPQSSSLYFYLFFRPLTYFVFYFYFYLLNADAILIKLLSLLLHIVLIVSIPYFLRNLAEILSITIKQKYLILFAFIFSFIYSSLLWVYWICNINELLMFIFYLFSIWMYLLFVKTNKTYLLIIQFLFFIISVLFKQTSLHIPFLILVVTYLMKNNINKIIIKKIIISIVLSFAFIITFLIITSGNYVDNLGFWENIWKKPFSVVGSMMLSFFPFISRPLYFYFVENKIIAFIIFSIILVVLLIIFYKNKIKFKNIILSLLFIVIIYFPRIIGETEYASRTYSIQIFWILSVLFYIINNIKNKLRQNIISFLVVIVLFLHSVDFFSKEIKMWDLSVKQITEFKNLKMNSSNTFIITAMDSYILPYEYYYVVHNSFGKDSVKVSPFEYNIYSCNKFNDISGEKYIDCKKSSDTIYISKKINSVTLSYSLTFGDINKYVILSEENSFYRGQNFINFIIPQNIFENKYDYIYYDGIEWKKF